MGGQPGNPSTGAFRLRVHGLVERPLTIDFAALLAAPQTTLDLDVHCVTGWSVLGAPFAGVQLQALAERAVVRPSARYVVFEAAHRYTANVPLREALKENVLIVHR